MSELRLGESSRTQFIHPVTKYDSGGHDPGNEDSEWVKVVIPSSDSDNPSPTTYYYNPKRHLVADEPLFHWPDLPPLDDRDDEDYVEFYQKDGQFYKIRHKQRSYELAVSQLSDGALSGSSIVKSSRERLSATNRSYRDYWKYVQHHPSAHSKTIRLLLLDRRTEALSLCRSGKLDSVVSGEPDSMSDTHDQCYRHLSILDGLGPDGDTKIIRTIAKVLGGATDSVSSMITSDDAHWMQMEHPNGWLYNYHPIHCVVIDAPVEPFQIPVLFRPNINEDEEICKIGSGFVMIHHRLRSVSRGKREEHPVNHARREYWDHIAKYPSHHPIHVRKIIMRARKEAMLFLQWCSLEALMPSPSPTAPFGLEVSRNLHELLSRADETPSVDAMQDAQSIMILAKVLERKYDVRASYQFGVKRQVDFQKPGKPVLSQKFSSPGNFFLVALMGSVFLAFPFRYLRYFTELDTSFLRAEHWRLHIQRLVKEWTDSNLLATVLLAAAVSFLGITGNHVVSRTAVLISILSALGSLVAGLFCVSKYQSHISEDQAIRSPASDYAKNYINNLLVHQYKRRLYYATILSLPMVLLLWSMISFSAAVIAFNFSQATSRASQSVVSLWAVILGMSAMVVLGVEFAWSSPSGRFGTLRRVVPGTSTAVISRAQPDKAIV